MADINKTTADAGAALQSIYNQAAGFSDSSAILSHQVGDATSLVTKTANLAELQAQEQNLAAATALGTNPADASFMLNKLASDMHARYAERDAAILATQQAADTNIFTDGIGAWLGAQLDIPTLNHQQDVSEARYDNARLQFQQLNQLTQTATVTNNAIAQTKSLSSIEAESEAIAAEATIKANTARIQGLQFNAQGINDAQTMRQRVFDNNMRIRSEARADEQMRMARENAARIRKEADQSKKDVTTYLNAVNVHRVSIGQSPLDESMMRLKMTTMAGKLEMDNSFELGLVSAATGKQIIGADPFSALTTMNTPGIKVSPGAIETAQYMQDMIAQAVQANPDVKRQDLPNFVNNTVKAMAEQDMVNVGTKGNLYAPPPLATIADAEVANMPFVQRIVKPMLEAGTTEFQPEKLLHQGLDLVKKGEMTLPQVVGGVTALARKSVAYNNGYKNYEGFGLPKQKDLRMRMDASGTFAGGVQDMITDARNRGNPLGASLISAGSVVHGMFGLGSKTTSVDVTDDVAVSAYAQRVLAGDIATTMRQRNIAPKKKTEQ